ncbi:Fanconi anemia core complex-associated protein 20 [Trematomus bernacchii]|uniref:Fanconi anemia core complex-associated protein 20 n=1 Tax=Trematomus bernacchii TaxID=40690 RepID=UPI00146F8C27|nr:Fanconi anemia core complex-associated protein 20 [Trematomus bernacchii]
MAEKYSKSKLKRNKVSVKELQPEISSGGTARRSPAFPRDSTAPTGRVEAPPGGWWSLQQLPAAERLWAMALRSALQEDQLWDLPPPLPPPSVARPAAGRVAEQRWCDLSGEVPPLPRPSPPSPLRQQQPSVLSSHCRPSEPPTQTTRPPLHSWEEPPSPTTPSGDGGDRWRKEGETGVLNREQGGARRKGSLQRVEEHKEEGVQRTVGAAAGGGGLHSCPMCLLEFTVGSTQMERDGHLARCLSEVNVDMSW